MAALDSPTRKTPPLPTEILAEIVILTMAKARGTQLQDEFSFPAKGGIMMLVGMLNACKRFRAIVLREWFSTLRVSLRDWEYIDTRLSSAVLPHARSLYCLEYGMKSVEFMWKLPALKSVSFPVGLRYRSISSFPPTLEILECRLVDQVSTDLLSLIANSLPSLRSLRLDCGDQGPHQPICDDECQDARQLGIEFAQALKPLTKLRTLSLDVTLTPDGYPAGHDETCQYRCSSCWESKKEESHENELVASEEIANVLPALELLEWSLWIRQPKELKTRIEVKRGSKLTLKSTAVPYIMYPE
ncbi:hypothetical protein SISNIDRAFT_552066 [Sistotremastrum niveocremeum HHB9708]|uniref:F-box domain-containing protein n=1 Tax=Sistotremastrum niveocremeum HHB9708 TaxID=1314777 RepID=A0A164QBB8_9AGAM|nr:hypothetical protein SISNIDRAFT_552066 [Sistotremastrum niveocremeum HHB9708]